MKKKLVFMLVGLVVTMAANAQFEQGKKYIGSSLSGLNLSYNGTEKVLWAYKPKPVIFSVKIS